MLELLGKELLTELLSVSIVSVNYNGTTLAMICSWKEQSRAERYLGQLLGGTLGGGGGRGCEISPHCPHSR